LIIRQFGTLNARALLALQDQLSILEAELEILDQKCIQAGNIHNGSFRNDLEGKEAGGERGLGWQRFSLNEKIISKLKEYSKYFPNHNKFTEIDDLFFYRVGLIFLSCLDDFIIQLQQLRTSPPVPAREINNITNWFFNHPNAIINEEQGYMNHTADLMPVVYKKKTPFRRSLERSTHFRTWNFWKERQSEEDFGYNPELEHVASDERIDKVISSSIVAAGLAMLISPIWILEYVNHAAGKLGIITAFLVAFVLLLGFATPARPFETVAAAAA
jgi:hypothetical protein